MHFGRVGEGGGAIHFHPPGGGGGVLTGWIWWRCSLSSADHRRRLYVPSPPPSGDRCVWSSHSLNSHFMHFIRVHTQGGGGGGGSSAGGKRDGARGDREAFFHPIIPTSAEGDDNGTPRSLDMEPQLQRSPSSFSPRCPLK